MEALATPQSPLSFEAALAMSQTGRFLPPSSDGVYKAKPPAIREKDQDEDWC